MTNQESQLRQIIELIANGSGGGGSSNVDVVGNSVGLATGADIATVVTALADLPNIEINTDAINLNVQDLELLATATNALLTTIRNNQTNQTQFTRVSDGTDTLAVNADGSVNTIVLNNLPFNANYLEQTNPDVNGNFQTITYKQGGAGGTIVKTITLTFNSTGTILTYLES
jgi:hypothetical protein